MRTLVLFLLVVIAGNTSAQMYDNVWMWGNYPQYQDTAPFPHYGNALGQFVNDTFESKPKALLLPFSECNTNICDANGNLLFYTNGMRIFDSTSTLIENGDSINYGDAWEHFEHDYTPGAFGMKISSGLFIVKEPGADSAYIIIHILNDSLTPGYFDGRVCYSRVVQKTNGQFKITDKNISFSNAHPVPGNMAMCKHGNGRDWWIVFVEYNTNCYYKYLLQPDTIEFVSMQCAGDPIMQIPYGDLGICKFSLDGTKFLKQSAFSDLDVFDFDRCTGELSNLIEIPAFILYNDIGEPAVWTSTADFSVDNRLFYASTGYCLVQWDLTAADVLASIDTVAYYDSFLDTVVDKTGSYFFRYLSQYGPDGKIYFASGGVRFYSTIENPNGRGDSCRYQSRNIVLPKFSNATISQFPNYRLGRLVGSACDTVYSDVKPIYKDAPWLKVYPNPATDNVRLEYNWVEWEKISDCEFRIADLEGRIVLQQKVPRYSTRQEFSVKGLSAGVYTVAITDGEKKIAVCKLTKVE
ncbi:MAG: T9SS type A sorting domain-containing protein [Chitinophagales bacterium]